MALSDEIVDEAIDRMVTRVRKTAESEPNGFPHYSDDFGRWVCTSDGDWTGGFWVGLLWLSYAYTKDEKFLSWARKWMRLLRPRISSETVFRCFLFYYGAALGDILFEDREAREIAIEGASGLAKLYNPSAKLIPLGSAAEEAGNVGLDNTNVDGVMSIALLSYAADKTGDQNLRRIGVEHALSHIDLCILQNGAVIQSARFNPQNGQLIERYTHKGYSNNSVWARAQAWAMLGYALAAHYAPDVKKFIDTAVKVHNWWIENVPNDYVAYWDFNDPRIPATLKDTSATAIAAASLLKMSHLVPENHLKNRYYSHAIKTIDALIKYLTPVDKNDDRPVGMLTCGCYNRRIALATNNELVWGNYYLLESLLTLKYIITKII